MEKEIRKIENKVSSIIDTRSIEGYALVFNSLSEDLGGFKETIDPNSLNGVIERSDVFAYLNHNAERGVLARSKKGTGSLNLKVDETGLNYRFEAPNTDLGNETIEAIKRGDITASSFAFSVEKDDWQKQNDGTYIRTILQFGNLFDCSPVYQPAYEATSVTCKRFLEIKENELNLIQEKELIEEEKRDINITIIDNSVEINADADESVESVEQSDITTDIIDEIVERVVDEITNDDDIEENCNEKRNLEINKKEKIIEKRMNEFKLISAINAIANNRSLSELEQEVVNVGKSEMRKSGLEYSGQIQMPFEKRDITAGGVTLGAETIATQTINVLGPLYANLVLASAGAQFLTGLVGDVAIPTYSGSAVLWAGETALAGDGTGAFGQVTLKPNRLTATLDISKQFLNQDSTSAEALLMSDIVKAISEKLESTILGNAIASNSPAGFFAATGYTTYNSAITYSNITALEVALENLNIKNYSFICNPKVKGILKSTVKNQNSQVYEDGKIDEVPTFTTANVYGKGLIIGDFTDYVIGQWGSIDLLVDPYSVAANGKVRLIINAYFDAKPRRNSFVMAQLTQLS
jgi:HK97 family phage prohead protease/HK97 family phage major capsid protein